MSNPIVKKSLRVEYGSHLVEIGRKHPQVVALEADLKESTQSIQFQQAFPDRYFEVGVAEQNMIGIAAGLALAGKIPVTHSFACFTSMRACEQVRTTVAYPRLNVKLIVSHGGISAGTAGTTHHSVEDIAIMRAIPNMTVFVPGDAAEVRHVLDAAILHDGPVYIRLSAIEVEDVYGAQDRFAVGKATPLREGNDVTIVTTGIMMSEGVKASDRLRMDHGIHARVLQMASIKPIDRDSITRAAEETLHIVTVEEHSVIGGLGSAVSEVVAETGIGIVRRIGLRDRFAGIGSAACLMREEGLTAENIVFTVLELLSRRV